MAKIDARLRVTTILGSPRRRGHTATVLGALENLIAPTHDVERIDVADYSVRGCLGCDSCQKALEEPGCVQGDDGPALIRRLLAADVVVYAAPVYCWGFPGPMKALLDRHYCLVKWQGDDVARALLAGKPVALLATCGGTAEGNADLMQAMFQRQADYLRAKVVGCYVLGECTMAAARGEPGAQLAARLARDIRGVSCAT